MLVGNRLVFVSSLSQKKKVEYINEIKTTTHQHTRHAGYFEYKWGAQIEFAKQKNEEKGPT